LIPIGAYLFDKRNAELLIKDQRIELTNKEADLLLLLYTDVNTTVEREVILNMVWGDEGGYVGRTLDVFISKLRKKLEFDAKVKIVNIRGIGYKLVMDV
jgi:DNA-binding response OmpR family regulator